MRKKIVVTGASGFLGSHICEALHEAGYQVHALLRETSSTRWLGHPWITVHRSDLFNQESLSGILEGADSVIHAAAALIGASPRELHRVNVEGSESLAHAAIKAEVKRFVFISSNAAGGPSDDLVPKADNSRDEPISPYGKSKKRAEQALGKLSREIEIIILRPVMIYGPRDGHLVRLFRLVDSPVVPLVDTKPIYMPIIYVKDCARAAVAAVAAEVESGSVYYVSDPCIQTLDTIYDHVSNALGRRLRLIRIPIWLASFLMWVIYGLKKKEVAFTPDSVREFSNRFRVVSSKPTIRELGWKPQVPAYQGFKKTVQWYRDQGWLS